MRNCQVSVKSLNDSSEFLRRHTVRLNMIEMLRLFEGGIQSEEHVEGLNSGPRLNHGLDSKIQKHE